MSSSSRRLFLFSSILIHLLALTIAQQNYLQINCSDNIGNYTNGSTYQTNLNSLLSSLASNNEIDYGFYNFSAGQSPNEVYAIALCRGDIAFDDCRSCVSNATQMILQVCPNQKEAIVWYNNCMLRYSNKSIFGVVEHGPAYALSNVNNVSDESQFNPALQSLLSTLQSTAASGDSLLKFADGNTIANFQQIYALVQCTPDLSGNNCSDCLAWAIEQIPNYCNGKQGCNFLTPSCIFIFETDNPFFAQTPPPTSPLALLTATTGKKNNTSRTVIIIVVPIVGVVVLILCISIFLRSRRKTMEKVEIVDDTCSVESLQYAFDTIRAATDDFSDANKLGQGGFGAVYKGTLTNGQDVAVKRLSADSGQGDLEFKNEVLLVAKLQHRNLVRLQGFCLEGNERLLIYEFVPNTSLDHFIFDAFKRLYLDWEIRYKIIGGIARGLLYLHEDSQLRIIHRDLKASNILLDAEMNAKISDFGMAKLFVRDESQGNTSRIVGTYGYMAPEYVRHGRFSVKSDVYSFGVLLLEILSGQKNSCFRNGENVEDLLSCAWKFWREGTSLNIIDPILRDGSRTEMMRCIHIGLLCVQENVADRPTMASVVLMLSSYSLTMPAPSQPAFFMHSTIESNMSSSLDYNLRATESNQTKDEIIPLSANDGSITELYPR